MSGFFNRLSTVFRAKADKALDKMEDPRETLDYSYQKQLELLQKVRRGVADVATSRKRVELQANQLNTQIDKLNQQAQKALEVGREDLAREALTRKSGLQQQLGDLQTQHAQLQGEEEKLVLAQQRLQAKVESFRTRKETIKANYTAAEAQTRIGEAMSGIGEEMGDVGMAIQRAEDKTATMQARAGAIDELIASGALDDALVGSMREAGLVGLEAYHRDHGPEEVVRAEELAERLGLVLTGSSDYHGAGKRNRLGENTTAPEVLEAIEAASSGVTEVLRT